MLAVFWPTRLKLAMLWPTRPKEICVRLCLNHASYVSTDSTQTGCVLTDLFDCVRPMRAMCWTNRPKLAVFDGLDQIKNLLDCFRPMLAIFWRTRLELAVFWPTYPTVFDPNKLCFDQLDPNWLCFDWLVRLCLTQECYVLKKMTQFSICFGCRLDQIKTCSTVFDPSELCFEQLDQNCLCFDRIDHRMKFVFDPNVLCFDRLDPRWLSFDRLDQIKNVFDCFRPIWAMFWKTPPPNENRVWLCSTQACYFWPTRLKLVVFRQTRQNWNSVRLFSTHLS